MDGIQQLPTPSRLPVIGHLHHVVSDMLFFLEENRRVLGDRVRWELAGHDMVQLSHPADIEAVLVSESASLRKDFLMQKLEGFLGQGLITSKGDTWARHRKMIAPSLTPRAVRAYGAAVVEIAMQAGPPTSDIIPWTTQLTLEIVQRALFGVGDEGATAQVSALIDTTMLAIDKEFHGIGTLAPAWLPLPHRKAYAKATGRLDQVLRGLIQARRDAPPGEDLLWQLIAAEGSSGSTFDETALRDEALALYIAGHETSSLGLAYTIWCLGAHSELQNRLHEELENALGGRAASQEDLARLPLLVAVIKEAFRLYPPVWGIGREVTEDIILGDLRLPKGCQLLMSPWVVHHDERWFEDADVFRPERWLEERSRPRFAYFPFGAGARRCIGQHFAMMELGLVLATVVRRYRFSSDPADLPKVFAAATLRSKNGVRVKVASR